MTIDEAQAELKAAGWRTGDAAFKENGAIVWMVYCHRGETKLVANPSIESKTCSSATMNVAVMNRSSFGKCPKTKQMQWRQSACQFMQSFAAALCGLLFLSPHAWAGEPHEPATRERWTVTVVDTPLNGMKADSPHRYKLRLNERAENENRLVLEVDVSGANRGHVQKIVSATMQNFELPPLNETGKTAPSDRKPAEIAIEIQQQTKLRSLTVRFNCQEVSRLGLEREIDQLVKIVNRELRANKISRQLKLTAEE